MGRFADMLIARFKQLRERRRAEWAAKQIAWPEGFEGAIMWCPHCLKELQRIPEGAETSQIDQHLIVTRHQAVCSRGMN